MHCDVLLVSNLYPPIQIGGYEIAARDVAEGLRARGLAVHVLASDYRKEEFSLAHEQDISRDLKLMGSWYEDYPVSDPLENSRHNFLVTQEFLRKLKPRLVYAWNQANLGAGPTVAAEAEGVPVLHHIMGYDLLSYRRRGATFFASIREFLRSIRYSTWRDYRLADRHLKNIVFLSSYMKDFYRKEGVCPEYAPVVYPGIAVETITCKDRYEIRDNSFNVVFLGQLAPHKGVSEVKEALNRIAANNPALNLTLTLIGNGESEYVNSLLAPSAVNVVHRGFVNRADLYRQLSGYDAGVFSSTWEEPFGIAQIEMMAAGLPIVSSATGGAAEPLKGEVNSLVYNSRVPGELEQKFQVLIDTYASRAASLGAQARKTVEEGFSLEVMHRNIYDAVSKVIRS